MKQYIFTLFLFLTVVFSSAAQADEHLKFRGIPIEGKTPEFVSKLCDQGFSVQVSDDKFALLYGTFTGRNARIFVSSTTVSHSVYRLLVQFDKVSTWHELVTLYDYYVSQYIRKYGTPQQQVGQFLAPYASGDGRELQALHDGKAVFGTRFVSDLGTVSIIIDKTSDAVSISYEDAAQLRIYDKEKAEIDLDEI